jgi:DNA-binding Xre family transcriptional regulator
LLKAGIAGYSWKVAQCLKEVANFHRELDDYYTVGEAALTLKVNPWVVRRMVDAKEIECSRAEKMGRIISGSRRYIKIREVERIKAELDCRRAENDAAKRKGLKLTILARSLGVSRAALEWLRLKGKLRATLVRDDHGRGSTYLVVPWDEVECLKERKVKRR